MTLVLDRQAQNIRDSFSKRLWQDKMVALGKLASAAVHEINNPIQGILTFAKLMRESFDKESLTREEMGKSALTWIWWPESRSDAAKSSKVSFRFANEGLEEIRSAADQNFRRHKPAHGKSDETSTHKLVYRRKDNSPPIYCDGDQIKQALLNVVSQRRRSHAKRRPNKHQG